MNGSSNKAVTSFYAAPVAICLLSIIFLLPGQAFPDPAPAVEIGEVATFDEPWAMAFLPDGRLLVTEKPGALQLVTSDGGKTAITGLPEVAYGGQGAGARPLWATHHVRTRRLPVDKLGGTPEI